ncbi:hypothetical protein G6F40_013966 [Rhizopus arrhizus]|nr:hypothetical protein G6F40_013966 [Rhizopus arrhizus]
MAWGERIDQRDLINHLTQLQYTRNEYELQRGTFRVRGEVIDVFPAESDSEALRLELFDGEVEKITLFDPLTGETLRNMQRFTVYPKTHYATTRERTKEAYYFRHLFELFFPSRAAAETVPGGKSIACSSPAAIAWDASFAAAAAPSGRAIAGVREQALA